MYLLKIKKKTIFLIQFFSKVNLKLQVHTEMYVLLQILEVKKFNFVQFG